MNDLSLESEPKHPSPSELLFSSRSFPSTPLWLSQAHGMTIVEIMIVLTIVASLMGVIGFAAFGAVDSANEREAEISVKRLTENVNMYYTISSPKTLPNSLEDLTQGSSKIVDSIKKDPWDNDFIYTKSGKRDFEIRSAGKDGIPNNEDDICQDGRCSEAS